MGHEVSIRELWDSMPSIGPKARAEGTSGLPASAQRYLDHAMAPGTPLAHAVRLQMRGEIKLQRWLPFTAEEVIAWGRGFIWSATVRMFGMPIRGSDRLVDGEGSMRWRLFGIVPVMTAAGPDISRSAAGRVNAEAVWLPSTLCREDVSWTEGESGHARVQFTSHNEATELELEMDAQDRLQLIRMSRWGNPDGSGFRYADFGAVVAGETSFGGYTIPTSLRIGWYVGTERFESEGEFFRATVTNAEFR